ILMIFAIAPLLFGTAHSSPQKKKKAGNSPPTVKLETAPANDPNQQGPQTPAGSAQTNTAAKPAEKEDPVRAAWRINVEPYAIFGSGRPGKGAADFDKPDGVAFAPNGWLLATDAKNRRVQIWDVKTKAHMGEFGHGIFGGEIVDIAVAPNGLAL